MVSDTANLLLVDDNPGHLDLMLQVLKAENTYRIYTASTAENALKIINREEIHILLLDIVLPDMDGYEVCRRIRGNYSKYPVQIVLISGYNKNMDLDSLLDTGADDFINKPISPLELTSRVKAAYIRWRNQLKLFNDYGLTQRGGVGEEKISSLIEENIQLKDEYNKVRNLNQELERTNQELQKLASLDTLSGLLNRRTLFQRIEVEIERSLRLELPLTGIMIDIDHFKRVNDNHGHTCGDYVIKGIGHRLTNNLRKYDYAGRYGGEEFFVIFPNTNSETAFMISERFRKELEESELCCRNKRFHITVSIGIGQYRPGESPEKWIARADRAMYRAKQSGRNRVVLE